MLRLGGVELLANCRLLTNANMSDFKTFAYLFKVLSKVQKRVEIMGSKVGRKCRKNKLHIMLKTLEVSMLRVKECMHKDTWCNSQSCRLHNCNQARVCHFMSTSDITRPRTQMLLFQCFASWAHLLEHEGPQ